MFFSSRILSTLFLSLSFLIFFADSASAQSFVRTQTCGPTTVPCKSNELPKPLYWKNPCISFFINEQGSRRFSSNFQPALPQEAIDAVVAGFYAWNNVPGAHFQYNFGGYTNETLVRWTPDASNVNAIIWRDNAWPDDLPRAIALTSVSFNPESGEIFDADIELNSYGFDITYTPFDIHTDLQNTIAHEAGHFLGLAHTLDPDATMFGQAKQGETSKRDLNSSDIAGLLAIYPKDPASSQCHFSGGTTRIEVSTLTPQNGGCCSTTPSSPSEGLVSIFLVASGIFFLRYRKR